MHAIDRACILACPRGYSNLLTRWEGLVFHGSPSNRNVSQKCTVDVDLARDVPHYTWIPGCYFIQMDCRYKSESRSSIESFSDISRVDFGKDTSYSHRQDSKVRILDSLIIDLFNIQAYSYASVCYDASHMDEFL